MNMKALEWARKYYDAVVECSDIYQTSKLKTYRERAIEAGVLDDDTVSPWLYKADLYLIKNRERILDDLEEFFDWELEKFLHIEDYVYAIKIPLQKV